MKMLFAGYLITIGGVAFAREWWISGLSGSVVHIVLLALLLALLCGAEAEVLFGRVRVEELKAIEMSGVLSAWGRVLIGVVVGLATSAAAVVLMSLFQSVAPIGDGWSGLALVAGLVVILTAGPMVGWLWLLKAGAHHRAAGKR